ncbi:DUF1738 domain-containing protein [bacterium]|nr:DUF1738 domain-containing protein [bacterium]
MEAQTAPQRGANNDVVGIITNVILEKLEQGIVPWVVPWHETGMPTNLVSKKPYRGINAILLGMVGYETNYFLTENQLADIGGTIRPNEHPHIVAYWRATDGEASPGKLSYYRVYNVSQCGGISPDLVTKHVGEENPLAACEQLAKEMTNKPQISHKATRPFYDPVSDVVNMPKKSTFPSEEHYYATLLHQLVHCTGHVTRLDRVGLVQMQEIGYPGCSLEELVAEIASAHLYSLTGIAGVIEYEGCGATNWYEYVVKSRHALLTACSLAIRSIDYVVGTGDGAESVAQEE